MVYRLWFKVLSVGPPPCSSSAFRVQGLRKEIQTPMARGRSTKMISMIKWIRTSGSSMKNSLSLEGLGFKVEGLGSETNDAGSTV